MAKTGIYGTTLTFASKQNFHSLVSFILIFINYQDTEDGLHDDSEMIQHDGFDYFTIVALPHMVPLGCVFSSDKGVLEVQAEVTLPEPDLKAARIFADKLEEEDMEPHEESKIAIKPEPWEIIPKKKAVEALMDIKGETSPPPKKSGKGKDSKFNTPVHSPYNRKIKSWASRLGLKSGDEILSIGGFAWHRLQNMDKKRWETLLRKRPLVLRFRRDTGSLTAEERERRRLKYLPKSTKDNDVNKETDKHYRYFSLWAGKHQTELGMEGSFDYVDGFLVALIKSGGWARDGGVLPGDVLIAVNNKKLIDFPLDHEKRRLVRERPSELLFRRDLDAAQKLPEGDLFNFAIF